MARSKKTRKLISDALSINASKERLGLGVDLIEIKRFKKICQRTKSFTNKVFSKDEIAYCSKKSDPLIHLAARFAAKEAVLKSMKVGFTNGVGYKDVEVKNDDNGAPYVCLYGNAKEIAESLEIVEIPISLSHTENDAVCCAIAITKKSIEEKNRSKNALDELTKQFKSLRLDLDEI